MAASLAAADLDGDHGSSPSPSGGTTISAGSTSQPLGSFDTDAALDLSVADAPQMHADFLLLPAGEMHLLGVEAGVQRGGAFGRVFFLRRRRGGWRFLC